ncbi:MULTISPECIES: succinate dehydrogenase assembly factor 2 [Ahrensia]|jgi:antitoxin CptB|uniref:FAD assembly factor SdhE n=1 Tax=Ahrensia kielensis TaxID=76980 RepID=A0ABU9T422_9HYPH|nr:MULTISPECIES: succinate dehydrogenase assembly factor 2 [Ahrensia]
MTEAISLDARRKRARFRSWHRGMKEMDMILGGYADAHINDISESDLTILEDLMDSLDRDLFKWFTGEGPVPDEFNTPVFHKICAFHKIDLS